MDHYKSDWGTGAKCENIKNGGTQFKKNYTPTNYRKKTSSQGTLKISLKCVSQNPQPTPNHFYNVPSYLGLKDRKLFRKKWTPRVGEGKKNRLFFLPPAIPQVRRELR